MNQPFQKVVLRYQDGRLEKTKTFRHFSVAHNTIQVVGVDGQVRFVKLTDLKAVFFVKEFEGNPDYKEKKIYKGAHPRAGREVRITFPDGEIMLGRSINPDGDKAGFFLFPADGDSNNSKVFVPRSAVDTITIEPGKDVKEDG